MAGGLANVGWKVVGGGAAVLSAFATRRLVEAAWRRTRGSEPPENPASPQTTWGEALAWAAATGVAVAVSRVVARRGAAAGWRRATGALPPGVASGGM